MRLGFIAGEALCDGGLSRGLSSRAPGLIASNTRARYHCGAAHGARARLLTKAKLAPLISALHQRGFFFAAPRTPD